MVIYITNHEPYFYFIHHWILWSFYDHYTSTGSKTFLWRLIYCMGQQFCQIFLLNSETGRLRMLFGHLSQDEWRQTQIFISSLYIKSIGLIPVYYLYAGQYWCPQGQRNVYERLLPTLQLFSPLSHKKKVLHSAPQSPYPKNKLQSSGMQVRNAPKHYMHPTPVKWSK